MTTIVELHFVCMCFISSV